MMKSSTYHRVRVACQIIAIACAVVFLGIVNSDLRHWRFAFAASALLIAIGALSMILGMVFARREKTAK
jgi:membrane protein YdbS with pleckstrin-like domain